MRVRFHLPDFAVHYRFNMVFLSMLKNCPDYFRDGVEIASIYGTFPQSLWNGGRTMLGVCDKNYVKTVVNNFDKIGIPLRFTFSNPMITEEHLDDEFCNFILKTAENGKNGVIVVSPILEKYIRETYPGYKITSSTCKRITDITALNNELDKNYDIVVLDYDFNNQFNVLEEINKKEKCEILVNSCCQPGCKNRVKHYQEIGLNTVNITLGTRKTTASFKVIDTVGDTTTTTLTTSSIWGVKGFLGVWDQSSDLKENYEFSYQPYFVTPDGVTVNGTTTRTVNTQNNHYYKTFEQTADNLGIYRIDSKE